MFNFLSVLFIFDIFRDNAKAEARRKEIEKRYKDKPDEKIKLPDDEKKGKEGLIKKFGTKRTKEEEKSVYSMTTVRAREGDVTDETFYYEITIQP